MPRGRGYREVPQYFPRPGWVEHDPDELWESVLGAAIDALADAGIESTDLSAVGLANQRETTVVWDRRSGRPVHRAIVWQDRRTAERCRELPRDLIRDRTGLVPDPYFSATKLEWILSERDATGLAFGTVDAWLLWKLTGGEIHATDVSNASRSRASRAISRLRSSARPASARARPRPRMGRAASCSSTQAPRRPPPPKDSCGRSPGASATRRPFMRSRAPSS